MFSKALAIVALLAVCAAAEKAPRAEPAALRTATEKALAALASQSPTFLKLGGCNSCHNQFLPAVAHTRAKEKGLRVGETIAQLPPESLEVAAERIYEMSGLFGANSVGYQLFAESAVRNLDEDRLLATLHYLRSLQEPDGSWRTTGNRPPLTYDDYLTTGLAIHALKTLSHPADRQDTEERLARARSWLLESNPQTTQERAFHLLGLTWSGAGKDTLARAGQGLAGLQRSDGGWSQLPAMESDAYATGEALYALAESKALPAESPVYQSGLRFLLSTQAADGTWHVKARALPVQPYFESGFPYGHDQWISAAGTSWAAMALTMAIEPVRASRR
jgi:hypothetical protein